MKSVSAGVRMSKNGENVYIKIVDNKGLIKF